MPFALKNFCEYFDAWVYVDFSGCAEVGSDECLLNIHGVSMAGKHKYKGVLVRIVYHYFKASRYPGRIFA
ncbi:hypothetical protein D3C76_1748050 [compost metagenome]